MKPSILVNTPPRAWLLALSLLAISQAGEAQVANFGDLHIPTGGSVGVHTTFINNASGSNTYSNNGNLHITGNFTNNQAALAAGNGVTYFEGSATQLINGIEPSRFGTMVVDKGASVVELASAVFVTNNLHLEEGFINTSSTYLLTLIEGATVDGGLGLGAFVNGPLQWQTTGSGTELLFPIGKLAPTPRYKPLRMAPATASGTTDYSAEFMPGNPAQIYPGNFGGATLTGILSDQYWMVNRGGLGTARLVMDYTAATLPSQWAMSGGTLHTVPLPSQTNVAVVSHQTNNWNFTNTSFNDIGPQFETRHHTSTGAIYSTALTSYNQPFTIGFGSSIILPVRILTFDVSRVNTDGFITWSATGLENLAHFEVLHSTNRITFNRIGLVKNNGGTQYSHVHPALSAGIHYYKVIAHEKDGQTASTTIKSIHISVNTTAIHGLRYNMVSAGQQLLPVITSASAQRVQATITDMAGRLLATVNSNLQPGHNEWRISTYQLPAGTYLLNIATKDGVRASLKFVRE